MRRGRIPPPRTTLSQAPARQSSLGQTGSGVSMNSRYTGPIEPGTDLEAEIPDFGRSSGQWMVIVPVVLLLLIVGGFFGWYAVYKSIYVRPGIQDLEYAAGGGFRELDEIAKRMRKTKLGPRYGNKSDASAILNDRVRWRETEEPSDQDKLPPRELERFIERSKQRWIRSKPPASFASLDVQWIAQTLAHDHWNLEAKGPRAAALESEDVDPFRLPTPQFSTLEAWAKLRMLKAEKPQDVETALKEVVHLAELAGSTETLEGEAARLAILGAAIEFANAKREASGPTVARLRTLTLSNLKVLAKAPEIMTRKVHLFGAFDEWPKLYLNPRYRLGRCAALSEALVPIAIFRPWLQKAHGKEYVRIGRLMKAANKKCRLTFARSLWEQPRKAQELLPAAVRSTDPQTPLWLRKLPLFDLAVAERLYTLAQPRLPSEAAAKRTPPPP